MRNSKLLVTAAIVAAATLAFATPGASAASGESTIQVFQNTYNNPGGNYLAGASCLVPLGMADGSAVGLVTACGVTTTLTPGTIKYSVPATWPVWGAPGQTEVPNPAVLHTNGSPTLTLAFSSPRRWAGFELSPQPGVIQSFKADYFDASGTLIGTISKTIQGGQARLIGAKMFANQKVSVIQVTSNGDMVIARLRYKP